MATKKRYMKKDTIPDRIEALKWLYELAKGLPYKSTITEWCNEHHINTYFGEAVRNQGLVKSWRGRDEEGKRATFIQWISNEEPTVEMAKRLYEHEKLIMTKAKGKDVVTDDVAHYPDKPMADITPSGSEMERLADEIRYANIQFLSLKAEVTALRNEIKALRESSFNAVIRLPITLERI